MIFNNEKLYYQLIALSISITLLSFSACIDDNKSDIETAKKLRKGRNLRFFRSEYSSYTALISLKHSVDPKKVENVILSYLENYDYSEYLLLKNGVITSDDRKVILQKSPLKSDWNMAKTIHGAAKANDLTDSLVANIFFDYLVLKSSKINSD